MKKVGEIFFSVKSIIVSIISFLILLIISLTFINVADSTTAKTANWVDTNAIVTEIDQSESHSYTDFTYTYKEKEYTCRVGMYDSSYYVGKEVIVKVNPENPSECNCLETLGVFKGVGIAILSFAIAVPTITIGGFIFKKVRYKFF